MADRYWVGGSGNWSDTAHWSTSSGGSGGASVPNTGDQVYLDSNSTGTITASSSECFGLNCTGHTGTLTGGVTSTGGVTLGSGGTYSGLSLTFSLLVGDRSLSCNGKAMNSLTIRGESSTLYTLTCTDAINVGALSIYPAPASYYRASLKLKAGVTSTITSLVISAPASGRNTLQSSTAGVQATLSDSSGTNTINDVTIQDIAFTGGATWLADTNYSDAGNNTGLTFPSGSASIPALFLHSLA